MIDLTTPIITDTPTRKAPRDAFARLTPFGWTGGLIGILVMITVSFFAAGYFIIYWRNADMDFMVVYNALAMNDGRPQLFFDHPAYFTILSVKLWFQLLHAIGLLDVYKLSAIPSAANIPAFDAAMTQAIRAGRVVAWLTACGLITIFTVLFRRVVGDWRVALLAGFAFAFSGGVAVHMRILRSEMIAASLVVFALLILIAAARRGTLWRPLLIGVAATLCMLGLENKVHAVVLIASLPVLAIGFGAAGGQSVDFWRNSKMAWGATLVSAIAAVLLLTAAAPLIMTGLGSDATAEASLRPLLAGTFGIYQLALMVFTFICMIVFAVLWKVSAAETLASMFAVIAGLSLGLLALYLQYNAGNVVAVINPIEKMLSFADMATTTGGGGISGGLWLLQTGVVAVLKRYSFFLFTSARPEVFLVWLIVPGIVYAWIKGKRQVAIQTVLLLGVAIAIDTLGVRRGLKSEYFVLTDPLIIIAGAILLDAFDHLRFSRWAYPIGAALVVLHVGVSQSEPVKHVLKRSGPEYICEWNQDYQPLLPLPWCDKPPIPR